MAPLPLLQRPAAHTKRSFLTEAAPEGLHDALVDLLLLAASDAVLLSPMSTFGGFASAFALSGAPPWKATSLGECVRAHSPEPFFHHWQDVARELRQPPAPWAGGRTCALPGAEQFYASDEARSLGLWLLGGEASPTELQTLVERPEEARALALRRLAAKML